MSVFISHNGQQPNPGIAAAETVQRQICVHARFLHDVFRVMFVAHRKPELPKRWPDLSYWAVSDLNAGELMQFAQLARSR